MIVIHFYLFIIPFQWAFQFTNLLYLTEQGIFFFSRIKESIYVYFFYLSINPPPHLGNKPNLGQWYMGIPKSESIDLFSSTVLSEELYDILSLESQVAHP